jgi:Formin Homology 2 Domain
LNREHGKFDQTQLKALKEFLPDADERRGLVMYMKKGEKSEEERNKIFADLSETEKYMVTLMDVEDAGPKLDAMMFRTVFKSRCEDITAGTKTLNLACDEVRSSEKLRKLMAVILTVVNQINTGGEGKVAMGFTLDALLKLNEVSPPCVFRPAMILILCVPSSHSNYALLLCFVICLQAKAFDRKTSVLHYVVKLVKKNDESLLIFENDLSHVIPAESVLLDAVATDVKAMQDELTGVLPIVQKEADRLEQKGEIRKMSLTELAEQRTMVVGNNFNRVEHLTGRVSAKRCKAYDF